MLELPDAWVWDFWIADDGEQFHVFFLRASRALHDPDRRHHRASVGHAVSSDLRTWTLLADALVAADEPRWDDLAIWTGSVIQGDDGVWRMFYTGLSRAEGGTVQRIGVATSSDLTTWATSPDPVLEADPRWYGSSEHTARPEVFWRDPWVFRDADGAGWHMLVTALDADGNRPADDRGVLAHAHSTDLETWTVGEPVTRPGAGFLQLEVPQSVAVDGRTVLVFSCLGTELAGDRRAPGAGGSWMVTADSPIGPFDAARAHRLVDEQFYSAKLVRDRSGRWQVIAFLNVDDHGQFIGALSDPMPVDWINSTQLAVPVPAP